MTDTAVEGRIRALVRDVPDFPSPGVVFKDLTPVLADAAAFRSMIEGLWAGTAGTAIDVVVGIEARGFIVGSPVADRLGAGFVPVRKTGKLPHDVAHVDYALEYGTDRLEVHRDGLGAGQRALIVDDVLATGGTAAATVALVEGLGAVVVGLAFVIELVFLGGRARLDGHQVRSLVAYR